MPYWSEITFVFQWINGRSKKSAGFLVEIIQIQLLTKIHDPCSNQVRQVSARVVLIKQTNQVSRKVGSDRTSSLLTTPTVKDKNVLFTMVNGGTDIFHCSVRQSGTHLWIEKFQWTTKWLLVLCFVRKGLDSKSSTKPISSTFV